MKANDKIKKDADSHSKKEKIKLLEEDLKNIIQKIENNLNSNLQNNENKKTANG